MTTNSPSLDGRDAAMELIQPESILGKCAGVGILPPSTQRGAKEGMKTTIERYGTGTVWEDKMAYSRAVAAGPMIWVSGCIGILPNGDLAAGLQAQTERCLERIADSLAAFQAELSDVVKIRIYTTQLSSWDEIAAVVGPAFQTHRPTNLLVGVSELADGALVEIEAEAFRDRN